MNTVKLIEDERETWLGYFNLDEGYLGYYQTRHGKGWLTHTCKQYDLNVPDAIRRAEYEYQLLLHTLDYDRMVLTA